ncbi:MAG: type I restriction endonuclease subunit M, partial [Gemmatimonadetes bacterium]|nr:type I restriction endonuclease subunit M [Gemmatimonadota bacterium]
LGCAHPHGRHARGIVEDRKRKLKEAPDLIVRKRKYKLDLIPPELVVTRYFAAEQFTVETLQEKRDIAARDLEEFIEEHIGEEGLLEGTVNDKGKLTKANVSARLKSIEAEPGSSDERQTLERGLALVEAESTASGVAKKAQADLDAQVFARYAALSESEIKSLVVVDKWLVSIRNVIDAEVQRLIQRLGTRVQEIEERYARPLPELERDVEAYSAKVNSHLARMGITQ